MSAWPLTTPASEFSLGAPDDPIADYEPGKTLWVLCPCGRHSILFDLRRGWTVTAGSTLADLTISPSVRFPSLDARCRGHFVVERGNLVEA